MLRKLAVALTLAVVTVSFTAAHDASHHGPTNPLPAAGSSDEAAYLIENDAAMAKMMNDMAVKPTGDVDRDFVAMMIPHHQGAIDMARAVLRYGRNELLQRIAQEIIVDQIQEIAAMRLAVGEPLPAATASPTQVPRADEAASHQTADRSIQHTHQEP